VHVDANSSIGLCDVSGACAQAVRSNQVPYENAIVDDTLRTEVRDREFMTLDVSDTKPIRASHHASNLTNGSQPARLATGFFNIWSAPVDAAGELYFVDAHSQHIYHGPWSAQRRRRARHPASPVNLLFDKAGHLVVVSSEGE
jgi:hypothetical protein